MKNKTMVFHIENLDCANCAAKVEKRINSIEGVKKAVIVFATMQLRLECDDVEACMPIIEKESQKIEDGILFIPEEEKEEEEENHVLEIISLVAGVLLFAGGLLYDKLVVKDAFSYVSLAIYIAGYLILGWEVVWTAVKNIFKGKIFDENFLMSVATIGAFIIGEFPEAVGVMLFFKVGELFEDIAVERSRKQIMDAVDLRPETVNLVTGEKIKVIGAKDVTIGDVLLVRPGDRIPLDGIIVEGESRLDTSAITGEPVPVKVSVGNKAVSGSVNTSGVLKIKVEKVLADSMVSRILDSVENAAANKPKMDHFITRFAKIYTPIVVLVALFTAIAMPLILGQEFYPWVYTALSFLVMSCPCALVLSVPLAFFSGIGAGSKQGILFKGGVSIEAIGEVQNVVMDKTGTITKGNFVVQSIETAQNQSLDEILVLAASLEQNSTHPIGVSIVEAAKEKELKIRPVLEVSEISGKGISAKVGEQAVLCGNAKLMELFQVTIPDLSKKHGTEVYVAVDGTYVGRVAISDTIKPEAKEAIAHIKKQGIHTVMLTGDEEKSAEAIADETGVEQFYARLLPEDKLSKLNEIRDQNGKVMFVGDGINDAPVLAGADVGAAMGSGADAAIEAADVVFMNSNLDAIGGALSIAKRTLYIARQNVVVALTIKFIVMVLGLSGIYSNMWLAVFADTGVAFLCILNSVRLLLKRS